MWKKKIALENTAFFSHKLFQLTLWDTLEFFLQNWNLKKKKEANLIWILILVK